MRLWQQAMVALAHSRQLQHFIQILQLCDAGHGGRQCGGCHLEPVPQPPGCEVAGGHHAASLSLSDTGGSESNGGPSNPRTSGKGRFCRKPSGGLGKAEGDRRKLSSAGLHSLIEGRKGTEQLPCFATPAEVLIGRLCEQAQSLGLSPQKFEFEMLYGVRPDLQLRLAKQGWRVRLYLPFGEAWWPYAIRRVGESVKNAAFLAQAMVP
jgi:hypothetical protein